MRWSIGDNRNLFFNLKSKLGLYHVVFTTPKISPEKLTLIVDETQQLPDFEITGYKKEVSYLKWLRNNGSRKVSLNLNSDPENLNIFVYRYRNILYLKNIEIDLKLTENQ